MRILAAAVLAAAFLMASSAGAQTPSPATGYRELTSPPLEGAPDFPAPPEEELPAEPPAVEQAPEGYVLSADEITYDNATRTVIATGNVEISRGERILLADRIAYNRDTGEVTAAGNVQLVDPTGTVIFAERVRLSDDLRTGFLRGLRVLFPDDSRFAAADAHRREGNITELSKAVFSPCAVCSEEPDAPPLWQLTASRIVHDQDAKTIAYYNAFLEFYGVPLAYLPFFYHPDPTVKAKTGFLVPDIGNSTDLGAMISLPFFIKIAPHRDATITPLITTKEGVVLTGEYRERTARGGFAFSGSITNPRERDETGRRVGGRELRGHIFGSGLFDLDEYSRWGFDVQRTTDDTFLRRYEISNTKTLTSDLFAETYRGRVSASIRAFSFQGLRVTDRKGETPFILPVADYHFISEPDDKGGRFALDANALVLQRTDGTDSRRLSVTGSWERPYLTPQGLIATVGGLVRGDLYQTNGVVIDGRTAEDNFTGRVLPQLWLDLRLPLVRNFGSVRNVIEPIAKIIASPNGGDRDIIPNEDSVSFEFDDTNLFSNNRFPGLDLWEDGVRANYGLKVGFYDDHGGSITALFGQTYRIDEENDVFTEQSGLADNFSDFVGRVIVTPFPYLSLTHRFRLDKNSLDFRRNETTLTINPKNFRLDLGFVDLDQEIDEPSLEDRRELSVRGFWQFTESWSVLAAWRRDLAGEDRSIDGQVGLMYHCECMDFSITYDRRFTRDRDVEPSKSINIRLRLKHLG